MKVALFITLACCSKLLGIRSQDHQHAFQAQMEGKVVGGVEVPITMYPYVATFVLVKSKAFCGGSIIHDRVILTAAHCLMHVQDDQFVPRSPDLFEIALGATKWSDGIRYRVCKTLVNPGYSPMNYKNDLGLVLLSQKIRYGPTIQKINIANTTKWRNERYTFEIAGFGMTNNGIGSLPSAVLRATRMHFVASDVCTRSYSTSGNMPVPESMFCMIGKRWTSDCFGDSGSAILWKARWLVGTVTTGREVTCGSHSVPSMYTDAVYYRDWIFASVEQLVQENPESSCRKKEPQAEQRAAQMLSYMGSYSDSDEY